MSIKLTCSKNFLENSFLEYIEDKKKNKKITSQQFDLLKSSSLKFMFVKDLINNEVEAWNLFLDVIDSDLRSKNKKSNNTADINRKNFFDTYSLYHHHLINKTLYDEEFVINYKTNTYKTNKKGNKIPVCLNRNINDEIKDKCQTSSLYLHYQRIDSHKEIKYKFFLISQHPIGDKDWDLLVISLNNMFHNIII